MLCPECYAELKVLLKNDVRLKASFCRCTKCDFKGWIDDTNHTEKPQDK